ncbi:MAG TPA: low molecular weight phosphatase family protein [Verrucomicrobiales bacterium]|jgi:arsenate reductase|nr:low molecular weight phosphatase family protein [Pedosphaera sp.]MBL6842364.1 arsenate reductase ArsC [Verrucomicrobiae bacterium]RZO73963.1 MAG: arsenate reductase ArsC [Limisphaerales bacterium]HAO66530.1 low molecular weight phosphatase family protein [Verrucomicrobiales bacterium]HAQ98135.1 low molecular weight phosphatase family protein [Verrucomicrobiales bacterium]|tara:strand:- start:33 stop:518 length:486 start_codon:yes stop_codon:yes gene_type:complete
MLPLIMSIKKPDILILCTGNSCRSHMAEGVLRHAVGDTATVHSAGSDPTGEVHPLAVQVLNEIGLDISAHTSKHMNEFLDKDIKVVITVCDNADQACPQFPGQVRRYHWPFPDPAKMEGSEDEVLQFFRQVRDQIRLIFDMYAAGFTDGAELFKPADSAAS